MFLFRAPPPCLHEKKVVIRDHQRCLECGAVRLWCGSPEWILEAVFPKDGIGWHLLDREAIIFFSTPQSHG